MSNTQEKETKFHYGFLIVACCAVFSGISVSLVFGCAGIFFEPVCTDLGIGTGTFALYMTAMSLSFAAFSPIIGRLVERYSIRWITSALLILQAVCFFAQSQFTSVYPFYVTGALMGPVMALTCVLLNPVMINRWFKEKVGLFIGLSSSASGIGGIILIPITSSIIENYGWRTGYIFFGALVAIVALPFAIFVLRDYPSDKGLKPYGDNGETIPADTVSATDLPGIPYSTAKKTVTFVLFIILGIVVSISASFLTYIPTVAASLGMTAAFGATMASFSQIGNLVTKNVAGIVADKSPRASIVLTSASVAIGLILIMFFGQYWLGFMLIGSVLYGAVNSIGPVVQPLLVRLSFGSKNYGSIFGTISLFSALVGAFFSSVWGFLADFTGSYLIPVLILVVVNILICIISNVALTSGKKLMQREGQVME